MYERHFSGVTYFTINADSHFQIQMRTLYMLVTTADDLCNQFGTRSGKMFETLTVFLKDFFKQVTCTLILKKKSADHQKAYKITQYAELRKTSSMLKRGFSSTALFI